MKLERVDHLLWAGPDLGQLVEDFEEKTGIRASKGGVHPGLGTQNALVGLGGSQYLELLAPDPKQDLSGTWGATIAALTSPVLYTYAVRSYDIEADAAHMPGKADITSMSRTLKEGSVSWRTALFSGHEFGLSLPFLIDWKEAMHPSCGLDVHCKLKKFEVSHPLVEELRQHSEALQVFPDFELGSAGFRAVLETPKGEVVL